MFHQSRYRDIKSFYINYIQRHGASDFPHTVSYNRFVELQQKALIPMVVFLQLCCLGKCTGIFIIDSTPIKVCHIKREKSNKVFKGLETKEKSTIGWFFGFKRHIVINDKGEIIRMIDSHFKTRSFVRKSSENSLPTKVISPKTCSRIYLSIIFI